MGIVIRRNGRGPQTDTDRLGRIREEIHTMQSRTHEDMEIYVAQLRERVRKYERRYEHSSESMINLLSSGTMRETRDIALWAWTWQTLNQLTEGTLTTGTP